ncbi:MAG: hypothetical protein GY698_02250, partial [Actinomycetia bacterium]|nr:hypothetical protein [Actinomycetes bacterium]
QSELINVQKRLANMERVTSKQQYNNTAPSLMHMQTRYTPPTSVPDSYPHGSSTPRGRGGRGRNAGYTPRQQTAQAPTQGAPRTFANGSGRHNKRTCYICDSPDHFARFCPQKRNDNNVMGAVGSDD